VQVDPRSDARFPLLMEIHSDGLTVRWDSGGKTLDEARLSIDSTLRNHGVNTSSINEKYAVNVALDNANKKTLPRLCRRFIELAYERDLQQVKEFVKHGNVDVNCVAPNTGSALWSAMLDSRGSNRGGSTFDVVKYLVDHGANVKYTKEGRSISHLAGYKGREQGLNTAVFLAGLATFGYTVEKGAKSLGRVIQDGAQQISKDRERLGVTANTGVYNVRQSDKVTEVFCNRAPMLSNTVRDLGNGKCVSNVWSGTYKCGELMKKTRNHCD